MKTVPDWKTDLKKWRTENGYITPEWTAYSKANSNQIAMRCLLWFIYGLASAWFLMR